MVDRHRNSWDDDLDSKHRFLLKWSWSRFNFKFIVDTSNSSDPFFSDKSRKFVWMAPILIHESQNHANLSRWKKKFYKNSNWIGYVEPLLLLRKDNKNREIIQHSLYDFVIFGVLIDSVSISGTNVACWLLIEFLERHKGKQHFFVKKSNVSQCLINFFLLSKLGCESEALVARVVSRHSILFSFWQPLKRI